MADITRVLPGGFTLAETGKVSRAAPDGFTVQETVAAGGAVTGTGALTTGITTLAGEGVVKHIGTGSLTTGVTTLAGAGRLGHPGTGDLNTGNTTLSGTGTVTGFQSGTGALTTNVVALAGTGVIGHVGTGDLTTNPVTLVGIELSSVAGWPESKGRRKHKRHFTIPIPAEPEQEQRLIKGLRLVRKSKQEQSEETPVIEGIDLSAEISALENHLRRAERNQQNEQEARNLALLQSGIILAQAQQALEDEEFLMLMLMAA